MAAARASVWFLLCTVVLAATIQPLVNAHKPKIELYFLIKGTSVVSASPPGDGFGTIVTFDNYARTAPGAENPVVGYAVGQVITAKDGSKYIDYTYALNFTGGLDGSISGQGLYDASGSGESAITGGTGAFRSASGYVKAEAITPSVLLKATLYID